MASGRGTGEEVSGGGACLEKFTEGGVGKWRSVGARGGILGGM